MPELIKVEPEVKVALDTLTDRPSMHSIRNLVKGVELEWFQQKTLAFAIAARKTLVSLDTGLGKTFIALGLMNYVKEVSPKAKWIYVCEKSTIISPTGVIQKIEDHTDLTVSYTTAESVKIVEEFIAKDPKDSDVIVLSYESVLHPLINKYLFTNRNLFRNVIVDESHNIGNMTSLTARLIRGMCKEAEYVCFTTATPLRTNPLQFVNQIVAIDRNYLSLTAKEYMKQFEVRDMRGKVIEYRGAEQIEEDMRYKYVSYTRADVGLRGDYDVSVERCEPMSGWDTVKRADINRVMKSTTDTHAFNRLVVRLTKEIGLGNKGIVYCNTNDNKRMLLKALTDLGFKVGVIDGSVSNPKDRPLTEEAFNKGEYNLIITNITTSLNLQSDFIFFWELTLDTKQVIGRGERGLTGNDMRLVFFITKDTVEEEYFMENIYDRAIMSKQVLGKDVREIEQVRRILDL